MQAMRFATQKHILRWNYVGTGKQLYSIDLPAV